MSIHYKFKNALNVDTVTFDGLHISVNDLKKSIIYQKQLGNTADFDLKITNAQTKEEYIDEAHLIPKNTSLIIARIPLSQASKKIWDQHGSHQNQHKPLERSEKKIVLDLSKMNGSEEEKIQAMMMQSSAEYDPKGFQKIKGQAQTGDVPSTYRCNKCKKGGHWIKNCPYSGKDQIEMKRTTGIPKSFIEKEEVAQLTQSTVPTATEKNTIPEDLICSICRDIFTDAVMIPCCGSSFCDDCVRTSLLESEDNECPDCKEKGSSPGSLIPNRFLRNSVNTFKNETGYKRAERISTKAIVASVDIAPPTADAPQTSISTEIEIKPDKNTKIESLGHEKRSVENIETQATTAADIESDYEDNIVVTVPRAAREHSNQTYKIKSHDANHSRKLMPPGLEHSVSHVPDSRIYHLHSPKDDEMRRGRDTEMVQPGQNKHITPHIHSTPMSVHGAMPRDMLAAASGNRHDMYSRQTYQPMAYHAQAIRGPLMGYNRIPHVPCNSYSNYAQPTYNAHSAYILPDNSGPRPAMPPINLASVYQGVAAKVGSGVIDDPLEAFNRIMREKEREREHNRSPNRRRSSSTDKHIRGRLSPQISRRRMRSSPYDHKDDRLVDAKQRDRRGYSREREKISERTRWREIRKSRRNSRSRSRSIPSRKVLPSSNSRRRYSRSKSPIVGLRHQSNQRNIYRNSDKSPFSQSRNVSRSSYYTRSKTNREYEDDKFRDHSYKGHFGDLQTRERHKIEMHQEVFDISPPGTSEPPPPGYDSAAVDLMDISQNITESEHCNPPDIYGKYVSRDFSEHKAYRRDFGSDRSTRSKSSQRSPERLVRQSRSRTVSRERLLKADYTPKKSTVAEIHERIHKDSHAVKRRRQSEDNEIEYDNSAREDLISGKNKNENAENICKENTDENDFNIVQKKEQKYFEKKEDKVDKRSKERKKKKKCKEDKDRKKQKKKEKQSEMEASATDSCYIETRKNSYEDPVESKHNEEISQRSIESEQENNRENSNEHKLLNKNLYSYETDFEDCKQDLIKTNVLSLPVPSKWEREEQLLSLGFNREDTGTFNSRTPERKRDKVTEEVLRRAENAIFSKDGSTRHVIDVTKTGREKLNEKNSKDNTERVQITIPIIGGKSQRSIEIKEDKRPNLPFTPAVKKPVRDRLGSKVINLNLEMQNRESKRNVERDPPRERMRERSDHSKDRGKDRSGNHSKDLSRDHAKDRSGDHYKDGTKERLRNHSRDRPRDRQIDHRRASHNERPMNHSGIENYRKQNEKRIEKIYQIVGEKSVSSNSSNSEMGFGDAKHNKKRKHKKEKKRKKRSPSGDLEDGLKRKHNKSKKKYKTSKKNKSKI